MNKLGNLIDKPIHAFPTPSAELVVPEAKIGIEVELEKWDGAYFPQTYWEIHGQEHSLRNNGIEFVTKGGLSGTQIRKALVELCEMAKLRKWKDGYPRAAIHIHLDVTDLDTDTNELSVLLSNYMLVEHLFFAFAGEWRRDCAYCVPFSHGKIDFRVLGEMLYSKQSKAAFQGNSQKLSKYQALNLNPLTRFGTIEFRHLPTTFDIERIMVWINMILAIKKSAHNPQLSTPLKAMSDLGPERFAAIVMDRMWPIVSQHINPAAMWEAVDNAQAIMAHGGAFKMQTVGWDVLPAPNPILEHKMQQLTKEKKPAYKKLDEGRYI